MAYGKDKKIIILSSVIMCSFLFILVFTFSSFAVMHGDINGDNLISSADSRLALRLAVGLNDKGTEKNYYPIAADVILDDNGISAADARLILRAAVGLEDISDAHKFGDYIWEDGRDTPSCTVSAIAVSECTVCGATKTKTKEALGHIIIEHPEKEPTCTEYGWNKYQTCARCDYTTCSFISAKGHSFVLTTKKKAICSVCGKTLDRSFLQLAYSAKSNNQTETPYVLTSTGDTTDRTAEIEAVLSKNGVCILGTGTFYISNLFVGDYCSLFGSGIGKTILYMEESATGNAVTFGTRSSISDLTINGGEKETSSENGKRNGIAWIGSYITPDNPGTSPHRGQLSNIQIFGFSGAGIICSNTSMLVTTGLNVVNVNIYRCWAGIYIPIYSEYHRFTNIEIDFCKYGVINNGGNNMFVNCGFNANDIGFFIDNRNGEAPNNAHGSAIGCTFNHSGLNNGTAIKLDGVNSGYIFNGCQIFYGGIDLKNSIGVQFSNCNIGMSVPIMIDGGGIVLFNGTIFREHPVFTTSNDPVLVIDNCYTRDGSKIVL